MIYEIREVEGGSSKEKVSLAFENLVDLISLDFNFSTTVHIIRGRPHRVWYCYYIEKREWRASKYDAFLLYKKTCRTADSPDDALIK
ncbi:hypothetical protein [Bacillus thuringiensis]|uniref:hypothetical protein n=1 Tax=Bacillus thuringiensis TaxID=1428 RepID=UPI0020D28109|nr:hypothetical protein [Bacillus thuringiensis]